MADFEKMGGVFHERDIAGNIEKVAAGGETEHEILELIVAGTPETALSAEEAAGQQ